MRASTGLLLAIVATALLSASLPPPARDVAEASAGAGKATQRLDPASAVTIDFERAPGPDGALGTPDDVALSEEEAIAGQFRSLGVVFSLVQGGRPFIATEGAPSVAFIGLSGHPDTPAASGVNTLTDGGPEFGTAERNSDIAADFTQPVYGVSLVLIDFRNDCPSGRPKTAWLTAYDSQGKVLDIDTFTARGSEPQGNHERLEVSGLGIRRVALGGTTQDCGIAIDDFTFGDVIGPVPFTAHRSVRGLNRYRYRER